MNAIRTLGALVMVAGGVVILCGLDAPAWASFAAGWFGTGWWLTVATAYLGEGA